MLHRSSSFFSHTVKSETSTGLLLCGYDQILDTLSMREPSPLQIQELVIPSSPFRISLCWAPSRDKEFQERLEERNRIKARHESEEIDHYLSEESGWEIWEISGYCIWIGTLKLTQGGAPQLIVSQPLIQQTEINYGMSWKKSN